MHPRLENFFYRSFSLPSDLVCSNVMVLQTGNIDIYNQKMQKEHVKLVVWLRSSPQKKLGPLDQPFFFPKITNNRVFWLRRRVDS